MSTASGSQLKQQFQQSYTALKEYFSPSCSQDGASNPGQLVLFAEQATKNDFSDIALECLQMYFNLNPPTNQFFIRAHLCNALITAPNSPADETNLLQALDSVMKAVNIAKKSECYYFLVYNASVILWQICRPFQRTGSRKVFVKHLGSVVKALEECKEQDSAWRLELLMGLVLCQVDAGQKEEALKTCSSAAQLAKKRVPDRLMEVLKMQVYNNLGEVKVVEKKTPEYNALYRLYKIKCEIDHQGLCGSELEQKLQKAFVFITSGEESSSGRRTAIETPSSPPPKEARAPLLLELANLCVTHRFTALAQDCIKEVPIESVQHSDSKLMVRREVLVCQLMVQTLGEAEELYTRSAVEVRLQAVIKMEETLVSALRTGDAELIQSVCVVLWNLCLPLLQPNLCHQLLKPLTAIAKALERIESTLYQMRTVVHFELAKICADKNQLETAIGHLEKALSLDYYCEYSEQVKIYQNKLLLRAQLYKTPDDPVDQAIKIIEQVCSVPDAGSVEEQKALFVKAGELLAPSYFISILSRAVSPASTPAEDQPAEIQLDEQTLAVLQSKGKKLQDYEHIKHKVEEHVKRLKDQNARKRCHTWANLAKATRTRGIWDVALAASVFCLQYESEGVQSQDSKTSTKSHISRAVSPSDKQKEPLTKKNSSPHLLASEMLGLKQSSSQQLGKESMERETRDITRTLAKVHCIVAECLVHELKDEGLNLGVKPQPSSIIAPTSTSIGDNELWKCYTDWAALVTSDAHKSFLKAAELGCALGESWIVCNAVTYIWNYNHHWVQENKLTEMVEVLRPLLETIKQCDLKDEGPLITQVCTALAGGLVQKWMPKPGAGDRTRTATAKKGRAESKMTKKGKSGRVSAAPDQLQVDPDAGSELKEALEVCEYGMNVSVNSPMRTRGGLLAVWVQCKQLLQQSIPPKTFGLDESGDPCLENCRAIVAVEMISRLGNKIWDFPNCPTLQEAHSLLSDCQWSDSLSEIELWVRLAGISNRSEQPDLVHQCSTRAIDIHKTEVVTKNRKMANNSDQRVENELLCLAHSLLGQSLSVTAAGNVAVIRKALEAFQDSARFGFDAGSYKLVIEACSHYWNTCLPLTNNQLERDLLREPLSELLELVASILEGIKKKKEKSGAAGSNAEPEGQEKDHNLLVSMYGVVFQAYIDRHNWNDGLEAAEHAMWIMPKGVSRQLAQHKLLFKSRMGKNVEGDMVRFQDEPEEFIASLWYKAASNATDPTERLRAYQNAIQQLQSECHSWTKVEYLLEFSKWLYQQQYPVEDALKQLHQVIHILLNLKEKDYVEDQEGASQPVLTDASFPPKPSLGVAAPSSKTPTQPKSGDDRKQDESGMKSIRQLEALMRVHIIMAQLHSSGSKDHWTLCIVALGYCIQIWKQIGQSLVAKTDGGKSTASSFQLPNNPEQWAVFEVPEQLLEDVGTGSDWRNRLNKHTIIKPMLTIHYLGILEKCLISHGLHPLAFPVLNMQLAVTECMVPDSKSFCQLLHMRMAELCINIGLSSAASTHKDKVGDKIFDSDDLARSRVEIKEYKAKKEAVKRVETKRSLTHQPSRTLKSATTTKRELRSPTKLASSHKSPCEYVVSDTMVVREVWVQQAMMHIQQGQYQSARELLNEALESCQTFNDKHILLQVTFGLASLALAEGDSPLAIQLLTEAQKLPSQLDTWLDGVLLLSEAIWQDKDYVDQHSSVMNHLMSLLQSVVKSSKNEGPKVDYVSNILKSRLAFCCIEQELDNEGSQRDKVLKQCDIMNVSAKELHNSGHSREAAQTFIHLADILRSVATKFMCSGDDHQECLLKAVEHYQTAVDILSSVYEKAVLICQPSEEVTLLIQRELVNAQLLVAELLMDIFSEYSRELTTARTELQQKSSIEKLIDNYVRETPVLSFVAEEWKNTAKLSVDRALSILTSGHMLARNDSVLKAKCTYLLGHCYHLLSVHTSPDYRLQWTECADDDKPLETNSAGKAGEDGDTGQETEGRESIQDDAIASRSDEDKASGALNQYSALSSVMRKEDADQAENEEAVSLCFASQAVHLLTEATAVALNSGERTLGMKTALEIVECCGVFDPDTASQYLALYQSLAVAQEMNLHLRRILPDPRSSKLGSLLKQNHRLQQMQPSGPALQANVSELMKFEVFKKLQVSQNHLDFMKSYPSHFRFVIFHHSPDKSRLYSAYLIPPQPPPPAPKKGQPPPEIELLEPVVTCADVCFKDLLSLLDLMKDFKLDIGQKLLKFQGHTLNDFEYHLSDILSAMEAYLAGVLKPIANALKTENSEKELCVVLLADSDLLQLPLEAITTLNRENIICVSRDFSLQILSNRVAMFAPEDEGEVNKDKKKVEKYQPQPTTLLGNVANFKYLLDPSGDLKPTEDTTTSVCNDILSTIHTYSKLTSKWSGHRGIEDHTLNVSDWVTILEECSGLVIFSTERLLAHFSPSKLASLRLKGCSMALLMDRMQTVGSSLSQSKLDYHKSDLEIMFEQPIQSAMLLSLTGCGCVVANQWNTTVQSNVDKINSLLQGLLSQSNTIGSLVWTKMKETLSSTQQTEEQQPTEAKEAEGSSDQVVILDSENKLKDDCKYLVSAYNCVLYGLPHITLIASP